jgi:hypothetical protein
LKLSHKSILAAWFTALGALPEFPWTNFIYPVEAVATTTDIPIVKNEFLRSNFPDIN